MEVTIQQGIPTETARAIVKLVKEQEVQEGAVARFKESRFASPRGPATSCRP